MLNEVSGQNPPNMNPHPLVYPPPPRTGSTLFTPQTNEDKTSSGEQTEDGLKKQSTTSDSSAIVVEDNLTTSQMGDISLTKNNVIVQNKMNTKIEQNHTSRSVESEQNIDNVSSPKPTEIPSDVRPDSHNIATNVAMMSPSEQPIAPVNPQVLSARSRGKLIMPISISVILLTLGIVGLYYFTQMQANRSGRWFGSQSTGRADQTLQTNSIEPPAGHMIVNRDCFNFAVPEESRVSDRQGCLVMLENSSKPFLNMSITPAVTANAGLNDLVARDSQKLKGSNVAANPATDMTLGGSPAKKIIYSSPDGEAKLLKVLVLSPKPNYSQSGKNITSFEITFPYKYEQDITAIDAVLESWRWK